MLATWGLAARLSRNHTGKAGALLCTELWMRRRSRTLLERDGLCAYRSSECICDIIGTDAGSHGKGCDGTKDNNPVGPARGVGLSETEA